KENRCGQPGLRYGIAGRTTGGRAGGAAEAGGARGHRCDASGNVLGQAWDERFRLDRFGFGTEVVAVITFTLALPGCGPLERSSARGAAAHSVGLSALGNVARRANAASSRVFP